MTILLNTVEGALRFLANPNTGYVNISEIRFGGELVRFEALIEGEHYHASIPAALARGLWEFQEELYRAVAFALYGEDNIRRLTDQQKNSFELNFTVAKGSSNIWASLEGFFSKLGEGFTTMDSKDKAKTLVGIALILALGWGGTHVVDTLADLKEKEIASNGDVRAKEISAATSAAQDSAKTEQFRLISEITRQSQVAARFDKATEEGVKAIIKGASDASRIRVGRVSFDRADILEVNQRAVKERAEGRILSDNFYVVHIEFRNRGATRVWIANKDYDEFPVTLFESDVETEDVDRVINAARDRMPIKLEVNATFIRGRIRAAQIVRVL